jgi:hypothetical protein
MVSEGRGRQPVYCLPRTRGKDGWRHWVGLQGPTSWGAYCVVAQALLCFARLPSPLPSEGRVISRGPAIGRVFDTAYRDACTIGELHLPSSVHVAHHLFRDMYLPISQVAPSPSFSKEISIYLYSYLYTIIV